ncbi:putative sugar kinase [Sphingobium sp. SYK-6]|uniref:bifunctional ADP-dependent NAD(P)H-hydrate dehydratase/NAD(P)H-hydrate epimerase n=1 Tax=Sphingobium sp. (strain NBRC 103272 / SYK-6) TaxID=627192 RepID=UPI0002277483|nr:bifunctional ADP-dependent NAD(P)H-hydrate dehydratase/NAD(P)H-hydrate epimerase [Sphingobium sp. SYK-6]BAK67122.1 putative sugar kinase [Sphingobium sp. SYK-6]
MRAGPILSVAQMRAAEQALFDAGVDPYALMCRAGEGAAEVIWRAGHLRETLVLCGPGNNGGDGYVVARALRDLGVPVRVAALAAPGTDSARKARAAWGGSVETLEEAAPAAQLVDALFGIGLTRGLAPDLAERLAQLVDAAQHSYAIDVPSGVESDAAIALSPVPAFTHCISLGAWKPAHVLMPSAALSAQHWLVDIGIAAPAEGAMVLAPPRFDAPARDAHKYTRGLVAVVAGDMPGASGLSAEAAARSAAGYVRLLGDAAEPVLSHAIVRSQALAFDRARAVLVGPGLGRGETAWQRLSAALAAGIPLVADADALWLIGERKPAWAQSPAILTPHEGEFAHLFGTVAGNKIDRTRQAATHMETVIVHKGTDTVIAAPDGRCVVAPPASAWLSTAGTGDVLAGLCAGRLAVTGDAFRAACEAVWLQGEAARRAGAAFVADDLLAHLPAALESAL